MQKKIILLIVFVTALAAIAFVWSRENFKLSRKYTGSVQSLRVGTVGEYSTLIFIAQRQGFFHDNGLDITTIEYNSGGSSFQALLDDKVDIATAADFVGVRNSFKQQNFKVITALFDSSNVFELIARKDHAIENGGDLKNKKIGLTQKTMGEFSLGFFLTANNISLRDITQINGEPETLKEAILKGTVDAIITFHPHTDEIVKKLGNNGLKFMPQGGQLLYTLLYAKTSLIKKNPDVIGRFIQALAQAEEFAQSHPEEVKKLFTEQFHYSDDYLINNLPYMHFRISLRQAMLLGMEDQARWIIENKLTDHTKVPNYLEFIYFDALKKVKPEAISIFDTVP